MEAAIAAQAACMVTGNAVHFPAELRRNVTVPVPAEFLAFHKMQRQ